MEKERILEFLTYQRAMRADMSNDLKHYQSGNFRTSKRDESGQWIDTTQEIISDLKQRIANLDRVIAAYESKI